MQGSEKEPQCMPVWVREIRMESDKIQCFPAVGCGLTDRGMNLWLKKPLDIGKTVVLEMMLPDSWPIYSKATVAWCHTTGEKDEWRFAVGVEFYGLSMDDESKILSWMQNSFSHNGTKLQPGQSNVVLSEALGAE